MEQLHFPANLPTQGFTEILSPANSPLTYLGMGIVRLLGHETYQTNLNENEGCLNILGGSCTVSIRSKSGDATYVEIGQRANVFAGKPFMVYLPLGSAIKITAHSDTVEAALITCKAEIGFEPRLIYPDETESKVVGKDNWQRNVLTSVGENVHAQRLLVGETINPPGNWSSSPPHKHDVDAPPEAKMEEIYHYRTNPIQGYGIQRIYTPTTDQYPFDSTYVVKNGDSVVIPRGYHPVVAAPGYQLYYLWALAGAKREYGAWTDDSDHAWIKGIN